MADTQPKVFFDYFVIAFPVIVSVGSFAFGKWWERRSLADANKFALARGREESRREKDYEILKDASKDISIHATVVIEYITWCAMVQRAEIAKEVRDDDAPSLEFSMKNLLTSTKQYKDAEDSLHDIQVRLLMLGMKDCSESIGLLTDEVSSMHADTDHDRYGYEYDKLISRCYKLRDRTRELLVQRYNELWRQQKESNNG